LQHGSHSWRCNKAGGPFIRKTMPYTRSRSKGTSAPEEQKEETKVVEKEKLKEGVTEETKISTEEAIVKPNKPPNSTSPTDWNYYGMQYPPYSPYPPPGYYLSRPVPGNEDKAEDSQGSTAGNMPPAWPPTMYPPPPYGYPPPYMPPSPYYGHSNTPRMPCPPVTPSPGRWPPSGPSPYEGIPPFPQDMYDGNRQHGGEVPSDNKEASKEEEDDAPIARLYVRSKVPNPRKQEVSSIAVLVSAYGNLF